MKIVHLSVSDLQGGAGRAAYRLHRSVLAARIDGRMLVQNKLTDDSTVDPIYTNPLTNIISKILPYLDRSLLTLYKNRYKDAVWHPAWLNFWPVERHRRIREADAVTLYWICDGLLGVKTIGKLLKLKKPVIWRLSDMWPFTGGCHYSGTCDRYEINCGKCPQLGSTSEYDLSRWVFNRKKNWWKAQDFSSLMVVCPSKWIAQYAKRSLLFRDIRIKIIPTGVDTKIFKPVDKSLARKMLNLPQDKSLILFGADKAFKVVRKGSHLLKDALKEVAKGFPHMEDIAEIVIYGSWREFDDRSLPFKVHALGQFINDASLPAVYSACDVFVSPSTEDNLPNTVIEALACGIPSVAFNIGGLPELIDHRSNGYLAKPLDIRDLAEGIFWVIQETQNSRSLSQHAREKAENVFNIDRIARQYKALYEELLFRPGNSQKDSF